MAITQESIATRRSEINAELATLQDELDAVSLALAEGDTTAAERLEPLERRKRSLNAELDGLAAASRGAARRKADENESARRERLRAGLTSAEATHAELKTAMDELHAAAIGLQTARASAISKAQVLARQLSEVDPRARMAPLELDEFSPGRIDQFLGFVLATLGMRYLDLTDPVTQERQTTVTMVATRKKAQARAFDATRESVLHELRDAAA